MGTSSPTAASRTRPVVASQRGSAPPPERPELTLMQRYVNMAGVIVPFIGILTAIVLLWNRAVDWWDLGNFFLNYLPIGLGVTIGYHRLLTHRSFETHKWIRYLFAILGSFAVQGPVLNWVADHRKHHAFTDRPGDPHSPHTGQGSGWSGFWHAHFGWLQNEHGRADYHLRARDLDEDPGMRLINKLFPWLVLLSLAIPTALGFLVHGGVMGAVRGLVWGGLVRVFFLSHVTWSINSVCHFWGQRRFKTDDYSTNALPLGLASLGEAWHNNHHAFPSAAYHGMGSRGDLSGQVIGGMERLGLAWDVRRISPERQREKEIVPSG
jgi:stearoyl-CoA desaturase (Delta-9 desaturase)